MGQMYELGHYADVAARTVAAIRLWPQPPSDGPEATECLGLVLSCLKEGTSWSHTQLLMQAAQALSLPSLAAKMCASIPAPQMRSLPFARVCMEGQHNRV